MAWRGEARRGLEWQEWANKAEALASYARMADDDSLRQLADRIQARAVRRMGELFKQFGGRGDHMKKDGTVLSLTQGQIAETAGISERQAKTAVRVANIPSEKFEALVESDDPPTAAACRHGHQDKGGISRPVMLFDDDDPGRASAAGAAIGTAGRTAAAGTD